MIKRKIENLQLILKKTSKKTWILCFIVLMGIFLRTYNFHNWLPYRGDQPRDAQLVSQVLEGKKSLPLMGPNMNYTGQGEDQKFHLGPIYYYFQIISGYIFGNSPDKFAYPDLLFAILSIPLFYFFLKKYFSENLSLVITSIYSISPYFIKYGRFAWNTNLIPFFVLLFLLSLDKFWEKDVKTPWYWVVALGFAIGIGFQLHAILIVLFSAMSLFVFLVTFKKNRAVWKKWAIVLIAILFLNAVQIYTELTTNFTNTRIVLNFSSNNIKAKEEEKTEKIVLLKNNLVCHLEANAFFLTSLGESDCDYDLFSGQLFEKIRTKKIARLIFDLSERFILWGTIVIPLFGYMLLFKRLKKESLDNKRRFLSLIALYICVFFVLMFPLSLGKLRDLRYFVPMFFTPFILFGFLFEYFNSKFRKLGFLFMVIFFILIAGANLKTTFKEAQALSNDECSYKVVTLGKIEPLVNYISSQTNDNKKIFIAGEPKQEAMLGSISSLLRKQNIDVNAEIESESIPEVDRQGFFISCDTDLKEEKNYNYFRVGQFYVYQVDGAFVKYLIQ